jgi:transposase-like protein
MIKTRWKLKTITNQMAKFEHYQFTCADCGQTFNLTRRDRFKHWLTCKTFSRLLGSFKTACSAALHLKKQEQEVEQQIKVQL